jgi:hypothetical protein
MQTLIEPLKQCVFCDALRGTYTCRILDTARCKDKKTKKVCTFYETTRQYAERQEAFELKERRRRND